MVELRFDMNIGFRLERQCRLFSPCLADKQQVRHALEAEHTFAPASRSQKGLGLF